MKKMMVWMIFFLIGIALSEIQAQSLIVKMNDGFENMVTLNTLQNLHFSESDMVVVFKSGSNDVYGLSDIRKLYFDASTLLTDPLVQEKQTLKVSPNPASDFITVQGVPDGAGFLSVYQMDGQLALTAAVNSNTATLYLGQLQSGLYLLFASGLTTKFIKQ